MSFRDTTTIYVVYSKLDTNYGAPFRAFRDKSDLDAFLASNKDAWGLDYEWEELTLE